MIGFAEGHDKTVTFRKSKLAKQLGENVEN